MPQLVLELFSEEIPARMQPRARDDLKGLVAEALEAAGLSFDKIAAYATPRRIALMVDGLPEAQPDISEEKRGPRTDAPEKAIEGFLRANEITLEQCERRVAGKGEFWFAVIERQGQPTDYVLSAILPDVIRKLPWQKSMRWGEGALRWVRPLKRILCVLDAETVPIDIGDGIPCGNITSGHRFLSPEPFEVGFFDDYEKTLQFNKVVLHAAHRRDLIEQQARKLVEGENLQVKRDAGLLAEVAGLVEWPVALLGRIDGEFMVLPDEVLSTSMRSHQKYFSVVFKDGKLAPFFVVVANIEADDGGAAIVAGNERVLRARLSDAKFFWDQDRRESLESRVPALARMVFHRKLGSLQDKVTRITALAGELVQWVPGADRDRVCRAATLCKADLTTGMVGEFAELQGVMGRHYALAEDEAPEVADAIADHYSPAGPDDDCPTKPVSVAVALADKIDTLAGFWAIDERPTGSRDPYALRRSALGIIRIVLENGLRIPISECFESAVREYLNQNNSAVRAGIDSLVSGSADPDTTVEKAWAAHHLDSLLAFFADRLKVQLRGKGVRHDLLDAVFAVEKPGGGPEDNLVRLVDRAEALQGFLQTEDGENLLAAYRRATNIVTIEEEKDSRPYADPVKADLLDQTEEKALHKALGDGASAAARDIATENFTGAMETMSALRGPVDAFFDKVTVNCDDRAQRENRLNLLAQFRATLGQIANFSQIEG
jgi:glycyl-tRNA synthetase beta chain